MYLSRNIDAELTAWRQEEQGKPLLIRGARQVGSQNSNAEVDDVVQQGRQVLVGEFFSL